MKLLRSTIVFVASLLIAETRAHGCTVFYAFDGKVALRGQQRGLGRPEHPNMVRAANEGQLRHCVLRLWPWRISAGWRSRHKLRIPEGGITEINPEDLYGLPQGGMNEKGLFFDGASTEVIQASLASGRRRSMAASKI